MTSPGSAARVAAASVPGCQHVLGGGVPCQDAVATRCAPDRVILSLSDGHGSPEYTHSDEGARIAVAVAVQVLDAAVDLLASQPGRADAESLENEIGAPIRRRIAFEWNRRVKHHARMLALRDQNAVLFPDGVTGGWDETVKPYGCTLLAAAFTSDVALWLRIGDGDALAVGHGGARRVFEAADKSMGQATYSLNMRNATEHMRLRVELERCELALLTSDGVGDQYDAEPRFEEEWGTHMLERVRTKGWIETVLELPRFLGHLARDGDDCSAAMAWFPLNTGGPQDPEP